MQREHSSSRPLDYARPGARRPVTDGRSLKEWGWTAIAVGVTFAVLALGAILTADGWVSDAVFDKISVASGMLCLLGGAAFVVGIVLCAFAASRNE